MHSLDVDGRLLTSDGSPVTLRGVAVGDPLLARRDRPLSDYGDLATDWGVNTVRLSVHPGLWRRAAKEMLSRLQGNVAAARAHGLAVVLDWHAIGWPGGAAFLPRNEWGLPADIYDCDLDLAATFWTTIASEFGADEGVAFELWNEPVRLLDNEGQCSPSGQDWAALKPIFENLLQGVRARASNLVLLSGGNWASDLRGVAEQPLADPRTAYAWHVYPGTAAGDVAQLDVLLAEVPKTHPVIVTEWGFGGSEPHLRGNADDFGQMFRDNFLERHQLHWTAWCWHPHWEPALIQEDWRTPTSSGSYIRTLLATDHSG